jgi:hypothetical protein
MKRAKLQAKINWTGAKVNYSKKIYSVQILWKYWALREDYSTEPQSFNNSAIKRLKLGVNVTE